MPTAYMPAPPRIMDSKRYWIVNLTMALENTSEIQAWDVDPWIDSEEPNPADNSFELLLDTACGRLWEKQVQYSIRRITAMKQKLDMLEKELDKFSGNNNE